MNESTTINLYFVIVNILLLLLSVGIFALNLKLYTEILKDKSQDRRKANDTRS